MPEPNTISISITMLINGIAFLVTAFATYVVTDFKKKLADYRTQTMERLESQRTALSGGIISLQNDITDMEIEFVKKTDQDRRDIVELQRKLDVIDDRINTIRDEHRRNHR